MDKKKAQDGIQYVGNYPVIKQTQYRIEKKTHGAIEYLCVHYLGAETNPQVGTDTSGGGHPISVNIPPNSPPPTTPVIPPEDKDKDAQKQLQIAGKKEANKFTKTHQTSPTDAETGGNSPTPTPPNFTEPNLFPDQEEIIKKRIGKRIESDVVPLLEEEIRRLKLPELKNQSETSNSVEQRQLLDQNLRIQEGKLREKAVSLVETENKKYRNILVATEVSTVAAIATSRALTNQGISENKYNNVT